MPQFVHKVKKVPEGVGNLIDTTYTTQYKQSAFGPSKDSILFRLVTRKHLSELITGKEDENMLFCFRDSGLGKLTITKSSLRRGQSVRRQGHVFCRKLNLPGKIPCYTTSITLSKKHFPSLNHLAEIVLGSSQRTTLEIHAGRGITMSYEHYQYPSQNPSTQKEPRIQFEPPKQENLNLNPEPEPKPEPMPPHEQQPNIPPFVLHEEPKPKPRANIEKVAYVNVQVFIGGQSYMLHLPAEEALKLVLKYQQKSYVKD